MWNSREVAVSNAVMLRHVQALEKLYLKACPRITWLSIEEEENNQSNLISTRGRYPDDALTRLRIPLNLIPSLKEMFIEECFDRTFYGYGSMEGFAGFTTLEKLNISGCPDPLSSLMHKDGNDVQTNGRWLLPQSLGQLEIGNNSPETLELCFPRNLTCLKKVSVLHNRSLRSLQLHSCTALEELIIERCGGIAALEGLQSLGNLRNLEVSESPSMKSLRLHFCTALEKLIIGSSRSLAALGLQSLKNLRILDVLKSPSLKSLRLHSCMALEELMIGECKSLAALKVLPSLGSLRHLKLSDCPGLASCLERLSRKCHELCPRLERLEIDDPSVLTTSFCRHLTSLQRLELRFLEEATRLSHEQETALSLLGSLKELQFWECWKLVDLPAGLCSLPSLERLSLYSCPGILRLPEKGLPPSLEEMEMKYCSEELTGQCRKLATSKLKVKIDWAHIN